MKQHVRSVIALMTLAAVAANAAPKDFTFRYAYPPAAARIAPLRSWLDSDRASLRAKVARDAAADRREAKKDGYVFRAYEIQKNWAVVTETPAYLSLSSELYAYSGGAHGNTGSGGLIWDKKAHVRFLPKAMFVSPDALEAAIRTAYCKALNAERVKRLGSVDTSDTVFGGCPKIGELTLLLGSTTKVRFDRIGLIADQYVAGSYAEGPYEITLPVTAAVIAAVRPEYRTAFNVSR